MAAAGSRRAQIGSSEGCGRYSKTNGGLESAIRLDKNMLGAVFLVTVSNFRSIKSVLQDLRYSWRELLKRPGIAITAILSLTLGIGATTAVFSVMYGLLANPYPYKDASRMVHLTVMPEKGDRYWIGVTGPELKALRQVKSFESVAAS